MCKRIEGENPFSGYTHKLHYRTIYSRHRLSILHVGPINPREHMKPPFSSDSCFPSKFLFFFFFLFFSHPAIMQKVGFATQGTHTLLAFLRNARYFSARRRN